VSIESITAAVLLMGASASPEAMPPHDSIILPDPNAQILALSASTPPSESTKSSLPTIATDSSLTPEPVSPKSAVGENQNDILVTARPRSVPGDPLQEVNAESFKVTQAVDKAIVGPIAQAYEHILPKPIRSGLRNFLSNIHEPVVFLNFLIQIKPGKAVETIGRFAINSTIGGAGLFDVAKRRPFGLPRRANGFADSLGYYGLKAGPFLFVPLIGPTTLRDLVGNGLDRLVLPLSVGGPFKKLTFTVPVGVLSALDRRNEFDEKLRAMRSTSDPYSAARAYYLQRRQTEIDALHGR
jgi:phospholipid-binding lipoprotein MlaA